MRAGFNSLFAGITTVVMLVGMAGLAIGQEAPRFVNIQSLTNQEIVLGLSAATDSYCRIQISSNLLQWDSMVTAWSTGAVESTDSGAPFADWRFYRARQFTGTNIVTGDHLVTTNGDVVIHPINHASLALGWGNTMIYVDPGTNQFTGLAPANLILFTHDHSDHFSASAIPGLMASNAVIIAPASVFQVLTSNLQSVTTVLSNGFTTIALGVTIEAVPMYNTNAVYHPYGVGNGYILTFGGKRVYIAGDTDNTPELRAVSGIDVAFIAVRPPYTMGTADAADAVRTFRPGVVYPYHYLGNDVSNFKQLVGTDLRIEVRLRQWY